MNNAIIIKNKLGSWTVPEGKPVLMRWRCNNKDRQGISTGIGWLKPGERPHTVRLVHSAFETWDKIEQEYPCSWTVWESSIVGVTLLHR